MSEVGVMVLGFTVAVALAVVQSLRLSSAQDRVTTLLFERDHAREQCRFYESMIAALGAGDPQGPRPAPAKHLTVIEGGRPSCSDH